MATVVVTAETFTPDGSMAATVALQSDGTYLVTRLGLNVPEANPDDWKGFDYESAVQTADGWAAEINDQLVTKDKVALVKEVEAKRIILIDKDRQIAELQDQVARLSGDAAPADEVKH